MSVIYDLGANNGQNLPYYLFKADKVVAVEGNPDLCEQIRQRFDRELQDGSLVLYNCVISRDGDCGDVPFYIHKQNHVLSQLPRPHPSKLDEFECVSVPSISMRQLVAEHGHPQYIKIDLEYYDAEVLICLNELGVFPDYVSAELHRPDVFDLFIKMGYTRFKLVNGPDVSRIYKDRLIEAQGRTMRHSFPHHSAGPFGNDIDGPWIGLDDFSRILASVGTGWKDVHVSRVPADSEFPRCGSQAGAPLVSVVVPVYNVENHIRQCVESLVNQTLKNIEIIFVDDASPDGSVAIIEEVASGDNRVSILRNDSNMGVGAARNRGLAAASGEYVKIIDSDDYLSRTALELLYWQASHHQVDIVFHDALYVSESGCGIRRDYVEMHKSLVHMHGHAAWWYLFRRQLLVDHPAIHFPEGPHPHEDTAFSFMLFTYCTKSTHVPVACINYRQHDQMVTRRVADGNNDAYAKSAVVCLHVLCEFYSRLDPVVAKARQKAFIDIANYFSSYCRQGEEPALLKRMKRMARIKRFVFNTKVTKSNRYIVRVLGLAVWFGRRSGGSSRLQPRGKPA